MLAIYLTFSRLLFALSFGLGFFAIFKMIRNPQESKTKLSFLFLASIMSMFSASMAVLNLAEISKLEFAGTPIDPRLLKEGGIYRNIGYYEEESLKLFLLADEDGFVQIVNAPIHTEISPMYIVKKKDGLNILVPTWARSERRNPPKLISPPKSRNNGVLIARHPSQTGGVLF